MFYKLSTGSLSQTMSSIVRLLRPSGITAFKNHNDAIANQVPWSSWALPLLTRFINDLGVTTNAGILSTP